MYVHHVSKIALEHLQGERSDWVMQQGLDSGLTINPNGTFVLSFPLDVDQEAGKIWYVNKSNLRYQEVGQAVY